MPIPFCPISGKECHCPHRQELRADQQSIPTVPPHITDPYGLYEIEQAQAAAAGLIQRRKWRPLPNCNQNNTT